MALHALQKSKILSPPLKIDVERRVSKFVSCYGASISGSKFALKIYCIFARGSASTYNRLCSHSNNSDVCRPRSIISGILVQNIYLCKALA